jgi:hypothetical protein
MAGVFVIDSDKTRSIPYIAGRAKAILLLIVGYIKFRIKKALLNPIVNIKSESVGSYANEIRENGFAIVENFYSVDECKKLIDEIDSLVKNGRKNGYLWVDSEHSDERIFGAESYSNLIKKYHDSQFIKSVADSYFKGSMECVTTLAASLKPTEGNKGSGGGWHYDARYFEFKSLVYLTDVEIENGPFQILKKSHHIIEKIKHLFYMENDGLSLRMSDEDVGNVISKNPDLYHVITGRAGTLVLVDTSSIHAGMPIKSGRRYSLFNYYYPLYENSQYRRNQYNFTRN